MQPTTSSNNSWAVFPRYVYNQADFDNPFINGRGFIYLLEHFEDEFHFLSIYKSSS